jgi:predicted choloylglycine hydrolase
MMKKIVNGIEIVCNPEEEASIWAEWAANEIKQAKHEKLYGHIRRRRAEYPSLEERIEALMEQYEMNSEKIVSPLLAKVCAECKEVNAKYPPPA